MSDLSKTLIAAAILLLVGCILVAVAIRTQTPGESPTRAHYVKQVNCEFECRKMCYEPCMKESK